MRIAAAISFLFLLLPVQSALSQVTNFEFRTDALYFQGAPFFPDTTVGDVSKQYGKHSRTIDGGMLDRGYLWDTAGIEAGALKLGKKIFFLHLIFVPHKDFGTKGPFAEHFVYEGMTLTKETELKGMKERFPGMQYTSGEIGMLSTSTPSFNIVFIAGFSKDKLTAIQITKRRKP